jgi:hypothetical protein
VAGFDFAQFELDDRPIREPIVNFLSKVSKTEQSPDIAARHDRFITAL